MILSASGGSRLCSPCSARSQQLGSRGRLDYQEGACCCEQSPCQAHIPLSRARSSSGYGTRNARDTGETSRSHRRKAARRSHGLDIDEQGHGALDQPRMHQLIRRSGNPRRLPTVSLRSSFSMRAQRCSRSRSANRWHCWERRRYSSGLRVRLGSSRRTEATLVVTGQKRGRYRTELPESRRWRLAGRGRHMTLMP